MAKKMISMKFEPDLIERIEAAMKDEGRDRTAIVVDAIEAYLELSDVLKEKARMVREVRADGPEIVIDPKPSPRREPTESALKRQVGFEHHAKQVAADGPVDVSSLDIAQWPFKRPVAPKKGK